MRPLQRWMYSQLRPKPDYETLICIDYEAGRNRTIATSTEAEMPCDRLTLASNQEFEVTPDVKFREITQ